MIKQNYLYRKDLEITRGYIFVNLLHEAGFKKLTISRVPTLFQNKTRQLPFISNNIKKHLILPSLLRFFVKTIRHPTILLDLCMYPTSLM